MVSKHVEYESHDNNVLSVRQTSPLCFILIRVCKVSNNEQN